MITNSLIKGSVFIDLSPSPSPSPSPRSLKVCSYLSQQAFNYRLIVLFVVCFFFVWRLMVGVGECHGKAWTCIVLLKKKKNILNYIHRLGDPISNFLLESVSYWLLFWKHYQLHSRWIYIQSVNFFIYICWKDTGLKKKTQ